MKKICTLLLLCLLSAVTTWADEPFRRHRYDAFKVLKVNSDNIVFVGNSITNMHEWWEAFNNPKVLGRGNSGGYSDEILANIESYIEGKPAKLFLMIGTNDLGTAGKNTPEYVVGNIGKIIDRIQMESPETEIYIQSILPSKSGSRTLQLLGTTNSYLKVLCQEKNVTYIDLWDDLMAITTGSTVSLDGLHLKASGYKIWCEKVAPYVGSECTYLDNDDINNAHPGWNNSNGMRVTYFSGLPLNAGDVLIVGDEMIHGGEWHELLHCDKVRNRGIGWGYGGLGITNHTLMMPYILGQRADKGEPGKIMLYAGVNDANGSTDLATLKTNYEALVAKTRELAPNAKIYILSLLPTSNSETNTNRVVPFNTNLQAIAEANENVEYVDIYTPMANSGVANTNYFNGNYVYGKGYAKLSQTIAPLLAEEGAVATTDEEATAQIERLTAREELAGAICQLKDFIDNGGKIGQYSIKDIEAVSQAVNAAIACLQNTSATVAEYQQHKTALNELIANGLTDDLFDANKVQDLESLTDGWYRIKVSTSNIADISGYVIDRKNYILNANNEYKQNTTNYYALKFAAYDDAMPATSLIHVSKGIGTTYYMKSINGHYVVENCTSARTATSGPAVATSAAGEFSIGKWSNFTNTGAESPYVGKSSSSNNTYNFSKVSDEELAAYKHYAVAIKGADNAAEIGFDASLTYTGPGNKGIAKVYNDGHFFFQAGYTPAKADFTASAIDGKAAVITIGEDTITVSYEEYTLAIAIEEAKDVLAITGPGYPKAESAARQTLQAAIDAAKAVETPAESDITTLQEAITAYKGTTTDIQFLEDGKAYVFTNQHLGASPRFLSYKNAIEGIITVPQTTPVPAGAIFVCHKVGADDENKFMLVNNSGKYLIFRGSSDGHDGNDGNMDEYESEWADFTFRKVDVANPATSDAIATGTTNADLFGCLTFAAKRASGSNSSNFIVKADGNFDQATETIFYNATYSNVFKATEVPYYNTTELTAVGDEAYATIYLPFATTVPEGLEIYAGNIVSNNLKIDLIEATVLPANTAVVLKGAAGSYTFVPATTAGTAVEGNSLQGTVETTASTPDNTYALDTTASTPVFGKYTAYTLPAGKAYITAESNTVESYPVTTIITAIDNIETEAATAKGAIYDLSGRRVQQPTRGIYVSEGKKVFVR